MLYVKYDVPPQPFYYTRVKVGLHFRRILKFYEHHDRYDNHIDFNTFRINIAYSTPWWGLYDVKYSSSNIIHHDIVINVPRRYAKCINNCEYTPIVCPICGNNIYNDSMTMPIDNIDFKLHCTRCSYTADDIIFNNSRFISVPF
jgi:hypothetical protein